MEVMLSAGLFCPETSSWKISSEADHLIVVLGPRANAACHAVSKRLPQNETLSNLRLSSPIPPSPPECNKCPAIIYFNSLPSRTDEMDSIGRRESQEKEREGGPMMRRNSLACKLQAAMSNEEARRRLSP
ncbi:hypothetical protein FQA47_003980 [Oryzias melastigma]|uniref:Uncharacterized protein n=1 Tax=Oryzias melastigma TaxID=30732 RepID=A0A834C032_ORYME|nr:hypothetical protein FQA47_003980 [Oryzias melastigma]